MARKYQQQQQQKPRAFWPSWPITV